MSNTLEQQARELLHRMGVDGGLHWSAGLLVELANLIGDKARLEQEVAKLEKERELFRATVLRLSIEAEQLAGYIRRMHMHPDSHSILSDAFDYLVRIHADGNICRGDNR